MNKLFYATAVCALSTACASPRFAIDPAPRPTSAHLRVISTNDVHGHLLPEPQSFANGARVGGAAELAAYIARERAAFSDGPTIILDGGDVMQGTPLSNLVQGRSTVDFFNMAGYSAAAIGNHEFDWGRATLRDRIAQAKYGWLSANIRVTGSDTTPSFAKPAAIVAAGKLRIGIIGLTTQETPQTTQLQNIKDLTFTDGAAAIDKYVPELRRSGADFVIVVAHSGASCDREGTNCHGEIVDWATRAHNRPDLIVAGHTHNVIQTVVNGIPIVESGSYGNRYNVVDLTRVRADSVTAHIQPLHVVYADSIKPDAAVAAMVERVRKQLGPEIDRVIATASAEIPRGGGESPMGRLIADGWRYVTGAQVAFMNTGGIRAAIDAGPITWGEVYSVHPFANRVVVLHLSGADLRGAIEHGVAGHSVESQLSGVIATYDTTRASGSRVIDLKLSDGTPVRDDAIYTVATNDFLATGQGDGFTNLVHSTSTTDAGLIDLDATIRYLQHLGTVSPPLDQRLRLVGQ